MERAGLFGGCTQAAGLFKLLSCTILLRHRRSIGHCADPVEKSYVDHQVLPELAQMMSPTTNTRQTPVTHWLAVVATDASLYIDVQILDS
jgi:hypothetical protein